MRVLVTGGAGYIGSHTAKLLKVSGIEPVVLDNLSTGHREYVRWGPLVESDLSDGWLLRRILQEHDIEAVMHFAGSAYVGESMQDPHKYFRNNTVNTINLLEAMRDTGVNRIIFSSSCTVYGLPETNPISEGHPLCPLSPYGESKLFVERMLRWQGECLGLQWMALRYFNAAGADPEGEIGEDHDPETHLIPLLVDTALGARSHVTIFGDDYPTADGTAIRDYIHVVDLASAHLLALQYLLDGGESMPLNLGTGRGHSVLEAIETVEAITGGRLPRRVVERREGDAAVLVADAARAARVLGWKPRYRDLASIVESAWRWHAGLLADDAIADVAISSPQD